MTEFSFPHVSVGGLPPGVPDQPDLDLEAVVSSLPDLLFQTCDFGAMLEYVTCRKCKVPMKELKGHIYHKQRKWTCPQCAKIRMQKQK
jgi:hypothetical protein